MPINTVTLPVVIAIGPVVAPGGTVTVNVVAVTALIGATTPLNCTRFDATVEPKWLPDRTMVSPTHHSHR